MYSKDTNPLFLNLIEKLLLLYNQQHGAHIFSYISKAEAIGWLYLWFSVLKTIKGDVMAMSEISLRMRMC